MVVPGSIPNMMRSFANFICYFAQMISLSHKAKQFLVLAIKLLIVGGAFISFTYSLQKTQIRMEEISTIMVQNYLLEHFADLVFDLSESF